MAEIVVGVVVVGLEIIEPAAERLDFVLDLPFRFFVRLCRAVDLRIADVEERLVDLRRVGGLAGECLGVVAALEEPNAELRLGFVGAAGDIEGEVVEVLCAAVVDDPWLAIGVYDLGDGGGVRDL